MGQNQSSLSAAMLTDMEELEEHFFEIPRHVVNKGRQEQWQDDVVITIEKSKMHWSEIPEDVCN